MPQHGTCVAAGLLVTAPRLGWVILALVMASHFLMANGSSTGQAAARGLGSAINEKTKAQGRAPQLASNMHALWGLDHYPQYLLRWRENEIDGLIDSLEQQLAKVRAQKQDWLSRAATIEAVQRRIVAKHGAVEDLSLLPVSDILSPEICAALDPPTVARAAKEVVAAVQRGAHVRISEAKLIASLEDETDGVHSVQVLREDFCERLLAATSQIWEALRDQVAEETQAQVKDREDAKVDDATTPMDLDPGASAEREAGPASSASGASMWGARHSSGESMAATMLRRPLELDACGFGWLVDLLVETVIGPLLMEAYPKETHGGELDWRHAFLVGYGEGGEEKKLGLTRTSLVRHTDDSEVTLNLCLGRRFQGGEVLFTGVRGTPEEDEEQTRYAPEAGRGVLHVGRQLHEVLPVEGGERFALVVWVRSLEGVRSEVCPCCWMNRRGDGDATDCICGSQWN